MPESVAYLESPEEPTQPVGRREAVVYADPDGCIDMRHFPIINAGTPYEDCGGPDQSFIEFTTERFDNFDVADSNTGNFQSAIALSTMPSRRSAPQQALPFETRQAASSPRPGHRPALL